MRSSPRKSKNSMPKRIKRVVPLEIEKLTEELVKKVDESKYCVDCKHWTEDLEPITPCWFCVGKSNFKEG